jgi:hypothetical protein
MDPRRFDGLTRRLSMTAPATSRRRLLGAVPALAALALVPRRVRAFDGGNPIGPVGGAAPCASGDDCAEGEVCVNGGCQTLTSVSGGQPAAGGELPVAAETTPAPGVATVEAPPTTAAGQTPAAGVGGEISATQPLSASIYAGTCGNLGADAAFKLIDIGPLGAGAATSGQPAPVGSTLAIPARFSTTVLSTTLKNLVGADFAVDIRVDAADPATSIACGSIGGVIGGQISASQLAIGLRERNQSGNAGIASLREENNRTVVDVFVAQGLREGASTSIGGVLAPPAQAAPTSTPTTEATAQATTPPATEEQAAMTPTVTVVQAPSPTPGAAPAGATPTAAVNYQVGDHLLTTTDVNLRAAPNTDAAVVTILGTGAELEVTGAPQGDWIPVRDVTSGRRGFVAAEFVQPLVA